MECTPIIFAAESRMNAEVAHRIGYHRRFEGVSLGELAEITGYPIGYLKRLENGEEAIPVVAIFLIASALEIPMLWLLTGVAWDVDDKPFRWRAARAG